MGDLFEEYHRHITNILSVVSEQIKACELAALGPTATQRQNLEQLNKTLASADETVMILKATMVSQPIEEQLELEARASDPSLTSARVDEIKRVRTVLKNASNRSRALKTGLERSELLGGSANVFPAGGHYKTLHENEQLLQKGSEYLQTTCAMAQETEMIGSDAAEELYGQRNMIFNVQNGIGEMKFSLKDADEYLAKLLKQGRLNRVILRAVIGAIIAAATIIVVSRVLRHFI